MKKRIKRWFGAMMALAMCITLAPTATAKADEAVTTSAPAVMLSQYSENQLLGTALGTWTNDNEQEIVVEKDHIYIANTAYGEIKVKVDADWKYEGLTEIPDGVVTRANAEDIANIGFTAGTATKALKFTSGDDVYYLYRGSDIELGGGLLVIECRTNNNAKRFYGQMKIVDGDAYMFTDFLDTIEIDDTSFVEVENVTTGDTADVTTEDTTGEVTEAPEVTETPEVTEAPEIVEDTVEEVTETPEIVEDTEDTEIDAEFSVTTTKDGRAVYAGEQVYVVKKGDCLWAIARTFLGP